MEEPSAFTSSKRKFGIVVAWIVLAIATPFALYMASLPCGYQEIGAASSYIKELAPVRVPQMFGGGIACCAALGALYFLATTQSQRATETKTAFGCGAGCLILLLLLLLLLLGGYSSG